MPGRSRVGKLDGCPATSSTDTSSTESAGGVFMSVSMLAMIALIVYLRTEYHMAAGMRESEVQR